MCCTRLAGNTGCKKSPFWHHRTTLSGYIFGTKACIDNRKKNLLSSNTSSTCPANMGTSFALLMAEICWQLWGTPANFNGFRVMAALLHGTLVVGVSQTLRHWTVGATYILAPPADRAATTHKAVMAVIGSSLAADELVNLEQDGPPPHDSSWCIFIPTALPWCLPGNLAAPPPRQSSCLAQRRSYRSQVVAAADLWPPPSICGRRSSWQGLRICQWVTDPGRTGCHKSAAATTWPRYLSWWV